jgi:hypothetical protein
MVRAALPPGKPYRKARSARSQPVAAPGTLQRTDGKPSHSATNR